MTVKPVKKKEQAPMELDPKVQKPDMEMDSPRFKEQDPEIPDHTHPEYDQMMVMLQEMQAELSQIKQQNGVESMDDDEDDVMSETLTGVPDQEDKDRSAKDTSAIGPDGTKSIPQGAKQTAVGDAPGDVDNEWDKMADGPAKDAEGKVPKAGSDYTRPAVQKNKLRKRREEVDARTPQQKEDPTEMQPGATEKEPDAMEGASKQRIARRFSRQQMEGDKPDEDDMPIISKQDVDGGEIIDDMDDETKPKLTTELIVQREFEKLRREIRNEERARKREDLSGFDTKIENLMGKKTIVGVVRRTEELGNSDDIMTARQDSNRTIVEYLQRAGNTNALRTVQGL